ncbi:MAG: hypothetical protein JWL83_2103 [Actinomycetia bacterium]|nr:hypothetical protein [Actinomycetes bacterium]
MAWARTAIAMLGLALGFVVVAPSPAFAHGTAQVPATDYVVSVQSVEPAIAGVTVRVVDNGARLELSNRSAMDVTVLGYDNEPYLRVGRNGVFENERSPAVYWNKQRAIASAPPPRTYNAKQPPDWHRISRGHRARWHDHRAHYMGGTPSDGTRVVLRDRVPLEIAGNNRAGAINIVVRYVPPPSALPSLLLAAGVAIALVVAARTRWWARVLAGSLAVLVGSALAQILGEWDAVTLSLPSRLGEHAYVFAGILLGTAAFVWILMRQGSPYDATPIALLAGVALLLASGLSGLPLLVHSELPTMYAPALERALIATTIGAGVATVLISATRLRRPFQAGRRQESSTANAIRRSIYAEK